MSAEQSTLIVDNSLGAACNEERAPAVKPRNFLATEVAARRTWVLYGGVLLYLVLATSKARGFIFDDPFIFFQYARNLAEGHGWVFTVGQHGTDIATSPLYVLILAAAFKVGLGATAASRLLFIAGLAGCACFTHATLARLGHWWAGAVAAFLIASSPLLFITRGMESALFLGAIAACIYLWISGSGYLLGGALSALVLLRPDGLLLAALIILAKWITDRRLPIRTLAVGGTVALAWSCFAFTVIGSFLPDTLSVKLAQGRSGLFGHGPVFLKGIYWWAAIYRFVALGIALACLALIGLLIVMSRKELRLPVGLLTGFVAILIATYAALEVPGAYPWYYAPLGYLVALLAAISIEASGRWLAKNYHSAMVVLPALGAVLLVTLGLITTPMGPPRPGYIQVSRWIDKHTLKTATVMAAEVGMLEFYTNRHLEDYLGPINNDAFIHLEQGNQTWWINNLRPEYWVFQLLPWDLELRNAPWFNQVFRKEYVSHYIVVYQRIGLVPTSYR